MAFFLKPQFKDSIIKKERGSCMFKILISPAKGFLETSRETMQLPQCMNKSKELLLCLQNMEEEYLKKVWKTSDALTKMNYERIQHFDKQDEVMCGYSYDGMAFKAMAPSLYNKEQQQYYEDYVRILSGLYGILRPSDAIRPYRLEMGSKIKVDKYSNLYDFWGSSIYEVLQEERVRVIVNLASKEYSKAVLPYIQDETVVTCSFYINRNGKLKMLSSYSKKARGKMVSYCVKNNIRNHEELKGFQEDGFTFAKEEVSEGGRRIEYIFVKDGLD